MLRLQTFGGLSLIGARGAAGTATAQRSRLALLAVLAASDNKDVSRDKLMAIFWPDSDSEHARNALNQAVFVLRRDLGDEVIMLGPATLRVNPASLESDIADFNAALRRSDWEAVVNLHAGLFLDGVFLKATAPFEQWVDLERRRIADAHRDSLMRLATLADSQRDAARATYWWKKLVDADPLSSRAALGYMQALSAAGDSTAALEFLRIHEMLVREALDVPVARDVAGLGLRLRDEASRASGASSGAQTSNDDNDRGTSSSLRLAERTLASLRGAFANDFEIEREVESTFTWIALLGHDRTTGDARLIRVLRSNIVELLDVNRFINELQHALAVNHANVVALERVGVTNGFVFFVNPHMALYTLRDRLRREPQLGIADAVSITLNIAAALEAAHAQNVLHLSLRPRNVAFVDGRAVLRDIGLASAIAAATPTEDSQSGFVSAGNPAYMSPEQLLPGGSVDHRSDIYSLGCVLYHMLSGEPPFGSTALPGALSRRVVESLQRVQRDRMPTRLEEILMTMLARVPADRFHTASAVRVALSSLDRT